MKAKWNYNLTVSSDYMGEFLDAMAMKRALEEIGYNVNITDLPVVKLIKHPVHLPEGCVYNINFHNCYHPCPDANVNLLFEHAVHDITGPTDPKIPLGDYRRYAGVFTPARNYAHAIGIDALKMAADPYLFHKAELPPDEAEQFRCDVVFIGNNHEHRRRTSTLKDYVLPLIDEGFKVHVYGKGWGVPEAKGFLPWNHAKYAYSYAKVGLNIVDPGMQHWGLGTNRLYQMGACGLPVVSYRCEDYEEAYPNGEVGFADTPEEFVERATHLLRNERLRKKMAKRIHDTTLKYHLWTQRIKDLFWILSRPTQDFREWPLRNEQRSWNEDIMIAIPGDIHKNAFAEGLMYAVVMDRQRFRFKTVLQGNNYAIDGARCDIVEKFTKGNHRILWMIDDDVWVPGNAMERLIADMVQHDLDIVAGWYKRINTKTKQPFPHFYVDSPNGVPIQPANGFPRDRLIEARMVPAGCLMIRHTVFERMAEAGVLPFLDTRRYPKEHPYAGLSEDAYFCRVARELGFKIFVDPVVECGHGKKCAYEANGINYY